MLVKPIDFEGEEYKLLNDSNRLRLTSVKLVVDSRASLRHNSKEYLLSIGPQL